MLYSKGLLQYDLKIIEYCEEIIDIVAEQCEKTGRYVESPIYFDVAAQSFKRRDKKVITKEWCEKTLQELKDNSLLKGSLNVTVGGANNEY